MCLQLINYSNDIIKNGFEKLKNDFYLKSKEGLSSFFSEVNDTMKHALRMLKSIDPQNCFAMYIIDFAWKMTLVRVEYQVKTEE